MSGSDRPAHLVRTLIESRSGTAFVEGASGLVATWSDVARVASGWAHVAPLLASRPDVTDVTDAAVDGGRVGLLVSDPVEMAAAFLSALAAGTTVAPLAPEATATELATACATLGLTSVVAGTADAARHGDTVRAAGADLWTVGPAGPECVGQRRGPPATSPGRAAAVILATSGTTGTPKLIPLGAAGLLATAEAVVAHLALEPSDVGYSPLPLSHINGLVVGVLATLVGGNPLVLDRRFSASSLWPVVARTGATWLNLVPAALAVLAGGQAPSPAVASRIAFARSASAPLPAAVRRRFERATGIPVVETYGMTETGSQICAAPRPPGVVPPGSVGPPLGIDLRIVDDRHQPVPAGTVGQVEVRGERVVTELWTGRAGGDGVRPALRADGWLETGDLGHLDPSGNLTLVGRADDVVNRGGQKVHPRVAEECLLADPGVASAAVVGRPHPTLGEVPVAFVVAAGGIDAAGLVVRLEDRCARSLSRYRRPAEIVVVDRLPCGPNGKIRRAALRMAARSPAPVPSG